MEKIRIGGIMQNAHLSLLNVTAVPDRPGIAAAILSGVGDRGINVQFIVQCIDQNQRDQVGLRFVAFTQLAIRISACSIEVAQAG